jgi:probable rRNA maturation factor
MIKNNLDLQVFCNSKLWQSFGDSSKISDIIKKIVRKLIKLSPIYPFISKQHIISLEISLLSDRQITKINQQFRNQNKATNVISLAVIDKEINNMGLEKFFANNRHIFLGEIFLSYERLLTEANNENKDFTSHLTHLILHSILHLIGFDHIEEKEADIMENIEISILQQINIKNPYFIS